MAFCSPRWRGVASRGVGVGFRRTDSMPRDRFCKLVLDRSAGIQMGQTVHIRSHPCPS